MYVYTGVYLMHIISRYGQYGANVRVHHIYDSHSTPYLSPFACELDGIGPTAELGGPMDTRTWIG